MGYYTDADGDYSTAMGYYTNADGESSTAMGDQTSATGESSTAMGSSITVSGYKSFGIGLGSPYTLSQSNTMAIMGGNVGIGTVTPASRLHILDDRETDDTPAVYGNHSVTDFYGIGVRGQGGWKGVEGTVSPSGSSSYYGVYGMVNGGSGTNYGVYGYVSGSGTNYGVYGYASGGGTNWAGYFDGDACDSDGSLGTCSSDERLKENIQPLDNGLDTILSLEPKVFNFIGSEQTQAGLIAQDLIETHPGWVINKTDGYLTFNDHAFIQYSMVKAIQEQQLQIEQLKNTAKTQQQQINELSARLEALENR
jgi:hypothetical protein